MATMVNAAGEAVKPIQSGQKIWVHSMAATPSLLLDALPSTAAGGTVSRIVPVLTSGAGVVTPRANVHYIVTEYGVATLRGKSLIERARALIAIAHPDHRDDLERWLKISFPG